MQIELDNLSRHEVHALLREHLVNMYELSPPESVHALDLTKLRAPDITFWTIWDQSLLLGCGALKELTPTHGEVKSMRTPNHLRRRGAGRAILMHILAEARSRGYRRLSLETGSMQAADGTVLEVFEWRSPEAIEQAHHNPAVLALWAEFEAVCDYVPVAGVSESQQPFSEFQALPF